MRIAAAAVVAAALVAVPPASAVVGSADVAALQVGLRARGLYSGPVDGLSGPLTSAALFRLAGHADASLGEPRAALGAYGRYPLGSRTLRPGLSGWDVAGFQFLLSWQGFPSGPLNGRYTARTAAAVRKFQTSAGLTADGVAGPLTFAAVGREPPRSPRAFAAPVKLAPSDWFGPRGDRFHTGLDYSTQLGTPVAAAARGTVSFAGWHAGGYGVLVTVDHGVGLQTMYAHLSRVAVRVGQRVNRGTMIARSGASGLSNGPHLHFELRVRDAAIDPLPARRAGSRS
jgi:peptidoglycan hydrolase-like protein with peptidoglycan-binding domain